MRNKLYKISTATLALAITFTFSCSDDDGGGTMACKFTHSSKGEVCAEISGNIDSHAEQSMREECEEENYGTFSDSCPSGYACKESDDVDDDRGNLYTRTLYYYDDKKCGDLK